MKNIFTAATVAVLLISAACKWGARSAGAPGADTQPPVRLESVEGGAVTRVILSAKAAERIDVKMDAVGEQVIVPTQLLGGIVVDPSAGGGATEGTATEQGAGTGASGPLWIRLMLSAPEWEKLVKDKPARVFSLQTRPDLPKDLVATPTGQPPLESVKSGMLSVFYVLPPAAKGFVLGDRVRVELQLQGGTGAQKVVPYSAVYYDAKGDAWVYVNTAPLTFMRERITVDRVAGELAVLSNGPAVGTRVVTVGVMLLYGSEIFGK